MFAADSIDTKKKNLLSGFLDDGDYGDAVAVGNRAIDGDAPPPNSESSFDVASRWDVSMLFETKKGTDDANVVSHSRRGHPYEEGRHHHHHHHAPRRLRVSPTPPGGGNKNNRHKNSELNAIHDAVNDTKNAKDLRQSLHELSKHMASNGGPTLPADITTRRRKQERRAVLEHFIEKVDEKATVEDDIKDKLSSSSHSAHQIIYQGVDGGSSSRRQAQRRRVSNCTETHIGR